MASPDYEGASEIAALNAQGFHAPDTMVVLDEDGKIVTVLVPTDMLDILRAAREKGIPAEIVIVHRPGGQTGIQVSALMTK